MFELTLFGIVLGSFHVVFIWLSAQLKLDFWLYSIVMLIVGIVSTYIGKLIEPRLRGVITEAIKSDQRSGELLIDIAGMVLTATVGLVISNMIIAKKYGAFSWATLAGLNAAGAVLGF